MGAGMILGTHDDKTLAQLADVASRAERTTLMADGHLGYVMPIGGVAAYRNKASVVGVGFDIACGNAAIRTDLMAEKVMPYREELANEIAATISFGVGRSNFPAPTTRACGRPEGRARTTQPVTEAAAPATGA